MLNQQNMVTHTIVTPVEYAIADLNLTLLPSDIQQRISELAGVTRIYQGDTPTMPDGSTKTFWHLFVGESLLYTEIFEGTSVADNFLADCLL